MISVVVTEVMQFTLLTLTALTIGIIALVQGLAPDDRHQPRPAG
jgi:Na+/proline symporter